MFFLLNALVFSLLIFYSWIRLLRLTSRPRLCAVIATLLGVGSYSFLWTPLFFGPFGNEAPASIAMSVGFLKGATLFLALFMALADGIGFFLNRFHVRRTSSAILALCIGCLTLVCSALSVFEGVKVPEVRKETLFFSNLPPELEGMRIAHLSDLHISALFSENWIRQTVSRTNALKPDLVVITGDFADGNLDSLQENLLLLGGLQAKYGIFACVGNHEVYSGMIHHIADLEQNTGIRFLNNSSATPISGLDIAGIADRQEKQIGLDGPDPIRALARTNPESFRIVLQHRPSPVTPAALQLSGHTHGGQLVFLKPLVALFNEGMTDGIYNKNGTTVLIHRGSGLWPGFPLRFGVPSEIVLITLHSQR
ncbi:MAG: metallophosphoesterase [Desulfovibrionaceae bacterium]|nr:metallophosphoesterase [Desulfovibrionaceae bacterium]